MTSLLDLFSNTADGVFAVDSRGQVALWNAAAEKILGYSAKEVIGKPCCEILKGRDQSGNRLCQPGCSILGMMDTGERPHNYDLETTTKTGQPIWLNVSIIAVPGNRPGLAIAVHLFRDVTHIHRLQELLRGKGTAIQAAPTNGNIPELTRRELQILKLIADGLRTEVVAERLHISEATVRNHVQNILMKLEVHSRLEAVTLAMRHALI